MMNVLTNEEKGMDSLCVYHFRGIADSYLNREPTNWSPGQHISIAEIMIYVFQLVREFLFHN